MELTIVMDFTLYHEKTGNVQQVTISDFSELYDLIEVYFNIKKDNQVITFNGNKINMSKHITEAGLINGDMLTISEKVSYKNNKNTTNALDEHMDDMILQSQISYTLVHIKGQYNDTAFKIIVDSGASTSVMSYYMAELLNIDHLIDKRMSGVAKGIGVQKIIGKILNLNVKIDDTIFVPINITILDTEIDKHLVLFGLDLLYSHGCLIDFKNRLLKINDQSVQFMNESEINSYCIPFNIKKETLKKQFDEMISKVPIDKRSTVIELLKKIITNIIKNPNDDKYKLINTESSHFKENLSKYDDCNKFMKQLGFDTVNGKLKFNNGIEVLHYTNEIMSA